MCKNTVNCFFICGKILLNSLKYFTHNRNITAVLSLHDLNMAARYGDYIFLIKDGAVYKEGSVKEVLTEENIAAVYGVKSNVSQNEDRVNIEIIGPLEKRVWNF